MVRTEIARLTNIHDTVRKYRKVNGQLQCPCPFHQGTAPTLIWNPKNCNYHCNVCQASGDLIDYVMKMEGWSYQQASHKLAGRLRHQDKGIVYVLELADGCYYVGYILDLVTRINQHFNGKGAHWTRLHPPVKHVEVIYYANYKREQHIAEIYMRRFGYANVRGGYQVDTRVEPEPDVLNRSERIKERLAAGKKYRENTLSAER